MPSTLSAVAFTELKSMNVRGKAGGVATTLAFKIFWVSPTLISKYFSGAEVFFVSCALPARWMMALMCCHGIDGRASHVKARS
jgi:hypothetical protein